MNQDQVINLNQNASDCIKSANKFGETVYTNICNGNVSHVMWGGADWALALFLIGLGTTVLLVLLCVCVMTILD